MDFRKWIRKWIFDFQIGSFFMINLCLVVIATQFSETKRRETAKMKAGDYCPKLERLITFS